MDKAALQQMYSDYLKEEGYHPKVDSDGDIIFKSEGKTYCIDIDERDNEFFRIIFPNFWSIDDEQERAVVLKALNKANARAKSAKVFIVRDNVWASIELFFETPELFQGVFKRAMSALDNVVAQFVKNMSGAEELDIIKLVMQKLLNQ